MPPQNEIVLNLQVGDKEKMKVGRQIISCGVTIEQIYKNNELVLDYRKYEILSKVPFLGYKEYKISKAKPYREGTAINDTSFFLVSEIGFSSRRTSAALGDADMACDAVKKFHRSGKYAQLGYSLLGKDNVDVQPSYTYLLANYPKKVTTKALDVNETVIDIPPLTCENYNDTLNPYLEFVLHKSGFVGAECIPNTEVPTDVTKCSVDGVTLKKYFENYKEAAFKGNSDTIKEVLIKFGAVRIYDGTVIIGWNESNWVTVVEKVRQDEIDPVDAPGERNDGEDELLLYIYELGEKAFSEYAGVVQGFVYNNGFTALRAALGLIAAVLVLPALLL
ncbi:MAG: hypothetical protein EZS28_025471 [Streblomastix strix]|uniref:Uncharacterized protein n=1 Tax=Streblomastix strix TaxID=222440 RepID=A0A5J4V984_9EUKA|nr:MAG: hypothetical protein EZS28_025471 [Streblomastix strix]